MKDLISKIKAGVMINNAALSAADNQNGTELDVGVAQQGTLILLVQYTSGNGPTEIGMYGSHAANPTQVAGNRLTLVQDTVNSTAAVTCTTANVIDAIAADGIYIFHVKDLKRYLRLYFDGDDTGTVWSAIFIAHQVGQLPPTDAQAAY